MYGEGENLLVDLSIVIVSYNIKSYLDKCLHSIYQHTQDLSFEILLVDNCSNDGTPEMVKNQYPQVRLIENRTNNGFRNNFFQSFEFTHRAQIKIYNLFLKLIAIN